MTRRDTGRLNPCCVRETGRHFRPDVRLIGVTAARLPSRGPTGLFDYGRADIDQQPLLQSSDLAEAVLRATAALDLRAAERSVKLNVTVANSIFVRIDRDGFQRALGNIVDTRFVTRHLVAQSPSHAARQVSMASSA